MGAEQAGPPLYLAWPWTALAAGSHPGVYLRVEAPAQCVSELSEPSGHASAQARARCGRSPTGAPTLSRNRVALPATPVEQTAAPSSRARYPGSRRGRRSRARETSDHCTTLTGTGQAASCAVLRQAGQAASSSQTRLCRRQSFVGKACRYMVLLHPPICCPASRLQLSPHRGRPIAQTRMRQPPAVATDANRGASSPSGAA
jgi:hypothetical protein